MIQNVTPFPVVGDVIVGRDVAGRVLRVSGHSGVDRVVLSIWDGGRCMGTVRLAPGDIPHLVQALVTTVVTDSTPAATGLVEAPAGGDLRRSPATATARAWVTRARSYVQDRLPGGR